MNAVAPDTRVPTGTSAAGVVRRAGARWSPRAIRSNLGGLLLVLLERSAFGLLVWLIFALVDPLRSLLGSDSYFGPRLLGLCALVVAVTLIPGLARIVTRIDLDDEGMTIVRLHGGREVVPWPAVASVRSA